MKQARRPSWYLYLLLKNRWFLIKALLIVMIPTVIVTFLLEKKSFSQALFVELALVEKRTHFQMIVKLLAVKVAN